MTDLLAKRLMSAAQSVVSTPACGILALVHGISLRSPKRAELYNQYEVSLTRGSRCLREQRSMRFRVLQNQVQRASQWTGFSAVQLDEGLADDGRLSRI